MKDERELIKFKLLEMVSRQVHVKISFEIKMLVLNNLIFHLNIVCK